MTGSLIRIGFGFLSKIISFSTRGLIRPDLLFKVKSKSLQKLNPEVGSEPANAELKTTALAIQPQVALAE